MLKLTLDRPLAFLDVEATGISPRGDRIVEISITKVMPDGTRVTHTSRVNPEMPIPPEVTKIHGITDADVADCPTFKTMAPRLLQILEDCDLAGYNIARYDIPMLTEEFLRADIRFDIDSRRIIDVQRIYHRREPRDLSAAVRFYCGRPHDGAHGAEADVTATIAVLEGQLAHYPDLPRDVSGLDEYCNPRDAEWVDRIGRLKWEGSEVVLNFSRKKGARLRDLIRDDPGFVQWILRGDFPRDVKEIITKAQRGEWPSPPRIPARANDRHKPEPRQAELDL